MRFPSPARRRTLGRRTGAILTTELLFTLPIFLLLMGGMMGMCRLYLARQVLAAASNEGAHVGALGGNNDSIGLAVRRALAADGLLFAANVTIETLSVDDGVGGSVNVVVVTTSAPVGMALVGSPRGALWGLADRNLSSTAVMQVTSP